MNALPDLELSSSEVKADAVVSPWFQASGGEKTKAAASPQKGYKLPDFAGPTTKELDTLVSQLKKTQHFGGKKGETSFLRFYPSQGCEGVLLLGLGAKAKWTPEIARQVGATVSSVQRRERLETVTVPGAVLFNGVDSEALPYWLQAFAEGYWMAGYEYKEAKSKDTSDGWAPKKVYISGLKGAAFSAAVQKARVLADSVNFARFLGDRPGNYLTPTEFGVQVQKISKQAGVKCSVWGKQEIEKQKMGLLLGVSRGSAEDPRFLVIEHKGGKKNEAPIALVGKGITFDSGGISLKPPARMEDMKYDMMGAAAVAGIMRAVGLLKLPVNVIGFIATCENMPDGKAQKPGDVAKSRSGKTVEIINTDAEGRLILADALEYAQTFEPQAILDFATLTGAVVDALGSVCSAVMGTNSVLIDRIKAASTVTAERVWELPLFEEYEEDLRSNFADIKNSGIREAGSSKGGTFLKFFVDPKYPWAHFDIAGTSYHRKDVAYHPPKNGAGVMVRLVTQLLSDWKSLS